MLFSDKKIADYINQNFEPAWKSVAPVPKVTIDFGGGRKIQRTVYGNIATYVCTADGYIVDILPGIYQPKSYLSSLADLKTVYKTVIDEKHMAQALSDYHRNLIGSFDGRKFKADRSKHFELLFQDTLNNEVLRRKKVHAMLVTANLLQPEQIYKRLYKNVLEVDIDDPYLGLKTKLDKNYPFHDPS